MGRRRRRWPSCTAPSSRCRGRAGRHHCSSAQPEKQPLSVMHVECFRTGSVRSKRRERGLRRYLPGGWSDATLPVNAFVLEHTLGLCVFDTGQTAAASRPGYHQRWHPFLRVSRFELEARRRAAAAAPRAWPRPRRRALGRPLAPPYRPRRHDRIVLGGRRDHLENRVAARPGAAGKNARLHPTALAGWARGASGRNDGPAVGPFAGSFDIAGDSSLLLVPTPTHTPGHLSMLADADDGRVLLGGDLAHTRAELARTAPDIAAWCAQEGVRVLLAHEAIGEDR